MTTMADVDIAVVDAGGAVGELIIELLEQRRFPVRRLHALSESQAGEVLRFAGKRITVRDPADFDVDQVQGVLLGDATGATAALAERARAAGCWVVDATAHGRAAGAALQVPGVNAPGAEQRYRACPNPAAVALIHALAPIARLAGLERVHVATYQAVSGAGRAGVEELASQTARLLNAQPLQTRVFERQIAFNCLARIGELDAQGVSAEEAAILADTRAVLELPELALSVSAVQVPVFFGHGLVVHLQTREAVSLGAVREALAAEPALELVEGQGGADYPTAVGEAANQDPVFIGRLREDTAQARSLNFWVVADNVRRSAALNSLLIAEQLARVSA
ncbi:aspartate-semialdehyde dehydrogenase [Alkalilimnicola sp. S0819]|uniref:aspartate-semialdehyde dehydrogenase n=1 Tax=Alkalilimnicola sp. S0819 TaxID=2613922 RepID=UPI0012618D72|nr:aspartate-semialdehyde dehydrogenase [Alkalilimnicola sp. S0819]KAB7627856.1 aspartate-semialdehyde dehydrogenase [Alkalilimnicola sp. S0819]MPQ15490.1 aspartate-semialdehyde dehydrogenase [Alkalilimnicola sp. S0819]